MKAQLLAVISMSALLSLTGEARSYNTNTPELLGGPTSRGPVVSTAPQPVAMARPAAPMMHAPSERVYGAPKPPTAVSVYRGNDVEVVPVRYHPGKPDAPQTVYEEPYYSDTHRHEERREYRSSHEGRDVNAAAESFIYTPSTRYSAPHQDLHPHRGCNHASHGVKVYSQASPPPCQSYGHTTTRTYVAPAPLPETRIYSAPVRRVPVAPVAPVVSSAPAYRPQVTLGAGVCYDEIQKLRDTYDGRKRYEVCYADLQPVAGGRVGLLYERLERASSRACRNSSSGLYAWRAERECEEETLDTAVFDTGLQGLISYHYAKTGRRTPQVRVGPLQRY